MGTDMGFIDKVLFSFRVMVRWEVLVTLLGFIAVWLLMRYIADPWSRRTRLPRIRRRAAAPPVPDEAPPVEEDDFPN